MIWMIIDVKCWDNVRNKYLWRELKLKAGDFVTKMRQFLYSFSLPAHRQINFLSRKLKKYTSIKLKVMMMD